MPLYEYLCPKGHVTEALRNVEKRSNPQTCMRCGRRADLIISKPHCLPDGVYSYAPNIGSPRQFERRRQAIKDGVKILPKETD